jgi:hypothetical protein
VLTVYASRANCSRSCSARWALAGPGRAVVLLALVFPGSRCRSTSIWLPLHWLLGVASYGLFGVAVVHAWLLNRAEQMHPAGVRSPFGRAAADASSG